MSRYRLVPSPAQKAVLRGHCGHARYVWNLAVEQHAHWRPGRAGAPGYMEQCRQLTGARAEHPWLAAGSQMVQQQALRDFAQAMAAFFDPHSPTRRPTWRKAGRNEGFRIVAVRPGHVRRLSRKTGQVWVPCNADVNAARNIAAGHAVTARGGFRDAGPVNREPHLLVSLTGCG
jgi:putative transposase